MTGDSSNAPVQMHWREYLDVEILGAIAPLVVLLIVATLRKGAFFKPDVVVLPVLCLALAACSAQFLQWLKRNSLAAAAGAAAIAWWIVDAHIWRHDVASWRLASAAACAAAGYAIVRTLPAKATQSLAIAVTALGAAVSAVGLALVAARSTVWTWPDERSLRLQGPLTYPSAIGVFLLLVLLASTAISPRAGTPPRWLTAVRVLVMLAVVATDSRGAIVGVLVLLLFRRPRRQLTLAIVAAAIGAPVLLYGQRDGVRPWLIALAVVIALACTAIPAAVARSAFRILALPALGVAGWLLLTQHHAVSGFDASWTERGHILRGAWGLFERHALWGAGPDPTIPTTTLAGGPGVDAFAHQEPLELLISVGIVGTAAILAGLAFAVRPLRQARNVLAVPAIVTVAAAGMVDFVWHFPAIGLLCGVVAALQVSGTQIPIAPLPDAPARTAEPV